MRLHKRSIQAPCQFSHRLYRHSCGARLAAVPGHFPRLAGQTMKILSFNVNGLYSIKEYFAVCKKWNFDEFLNSFEAEIICFQETKVNRVDRLERESALPTDYTGYFAFQRGAKKIGYSGVVTFCRKHPSWLPRGYEEGFTGILEDASDKTVRPRLKITDDEELDLDETVLLQLDSEGRCIITDHDLFILIHIYFPNDSGPERNEFRSRFYPAVWRRCLQYLRTGRSIILLGDINITYHPIDHCDYAKSWMQLVAEYGHDRVETALGNYFQDKLEDCPPSDQILSLIKNFYDERPMRGWLYRLLNVDVEAQRHGLKDVFRQFHPYKGGKYTNWNTLLSARGTNHGTRIDLILTAGPLFNGENDPVVNCDIWPEYMGSDHCPVFIELNLSPPPIASVAEPRNLKYFKTQKRLSDFFPRSATTAEPITTKPTTTTDDEPSATISKKSCPGPLKLTDFFQLSTEPCKHTRVEEVNLEEEDVVRIEQCDFAQVGEWRAIFNRPRPAPLCKGHQEPCRLLTVNKRGINRGRKFYACARGPGDKSDTASRCDHFEWYASPSSNSVNLNAAQPSETDKTS